MLVNQTSTLYKNTTLVSNGEAGRNGNKDPADSVEFKVVKVFFYFFILICSTVGNSMAAYVICSSKKMRTPSNLLILNLSACDLVTPLISIPFDFALEENGYSWNYGPFMCKFLWPCATLTSTTSALTLAAISLDRYRIIMHPFKTKLSSKKVKFIIGVLHIISIIVVVPYINALQLKGDSCDEYWPDGFPYRKGYTLVLFLMQYSLPLVFMVVMYTLAVKNLRVATHKMRKNSIRSSSNQYRRKYSKPLERNIVKQGSESKLNKAKRFWKTPNAKATKMFMVVVTVFAIFMFPNQVLWMWLDLGQNSSNPNLNLIKVICWLFTYTNSVCNPIIYCLFSQDFRVGFKRLLTKFICLKRFSRRQEESLDYRTCTVGVSNCPSEMRNQRKYATSVKPYLGKTKKVSFGRPRVSFDSMNPNEKADIGDNICSSKRVMPLITRAVEDENRHLLGGSQNPKAEDVNGSNSLSSLLNNSIDCENMERDNSSAHCQIKNDDSLMTISGLAPDTGHILETDC